MTVRVAMVGCGAAATRLHLPGYRAAGADVVAFTSRTRASADIAREAWGGGAVIDDWPAAIAHPDVDAVAVCVPNALHAEVTIAALRAGKHVLVEKPIATTLPDADAMIAAADAAHRSLMVAHDLRFAGAAIALGDAVRSGAIGTVRAVRASLGNDGPQAWSPGATWFRDRALSGGGVLIDLGVHLADAVAWLTGSAVAEVVASTVAGESIDETADVSLRMANGADAHISVSWQLAGHAAAVVVEGDRGVLDLTSVAATTGSGPLTSAEAFARALDAEEPVPVDGLAGRAALAVVLAAYEVARTGRRTAVTAAAGLGPRFAEEAGEMPAGQVIA